MAAMSTFDMSLAPILPNLVPILLRAATAGIMFYASMNWIFYRRTRREVRSHRLRCQVDLTCLVWFVRGCSAVSGLVS